MNLWIPIDVAAFLYESGNLRISGGFPGRQGCELWRSGIPGFRGFRVA